MRKYRKAARCGATNVLTASLPFVVTLTLVGYTLLSGSSRAFESQSTTSTLGVSVDPQSGEIQIPAGQVRRPNTLDRKPTKQQQSPTVVHRNGVTIVPLPRWFRTQVRASEDANGNLRVMHGVSGSPP